jgi:hypothetical protein
MADKLVILCVKTDKGCFISDCKATTGYDYNYHRPEVNKLFFDDKQPTGTYYPNWFYIEHYPVKIQREVRGAYVNKRYELIDTTLESDKMPLVIPYGDESNYNSSMIDSLYKFTYDQEPDYMEDVDCDIQVVCEIDNYNFPPKFEYSAITRTGWNDSYYSIKNADVQHQLLDKMIFPPVLLHNRPCKLSSKQMYDLTRQYILTHIDNSVAKITSNYAFCFEVKKLVPLIEPETITYQNIFGRTKKERNKIHTAIKKYEEKSIFEMTHEQEKYKGYSVIPEMYADSEAELKEKVDTWLEGLMEIINKPLCQCPHCQGTGYIDEIKKEGFSYKE